MAANWWTMLKTVPWSEVLSAAPQVASGARRLWDSVNRKQVKPPAADEVADIIVSDDEILAAVSARVQQHDEALLDMRAQLRSASELIANLAEQNAQLIAKVELQRGTLRRMSWLALGAAIAALVALGLVLART